MCSISVEPMPSRIGTPVSACQRACTAAGSASAADTQARTLEKSASAVPGVLTMAAYSAGTLKNSVGCSALTVARMRSGRDGPVRCTAAAPTDIGNVNPLPSP